MILAIASGKGGTGKTTVSVSLALALGSGTQLLDCDVEAPNDHLFFPGSTHDHHVVTVPIPEVDAGACDSCGECSRFCRFHAIASLPGRSPIVFPDLCHGCGGCILVCPRQALLESRRRVGVVEIAEARGVKLVQGRLDIGIAMATPLIRAVGAQASGDRPVIIDAPPGTSCAMVAAVRGADAAVLVAEPTPFGLHDLSLAVECVHTLGIPCGVIVNRVGAGDDRVHAFCREHALPVLAEIPDDRRIAEAYARGLPIVDALPEYRPLFPSLWRDVQPLVSRCPLPSATAGAA